MKVVGFLSQKGGSGKTTLAVHVAVAAWEAGMRTVLIDTDPQQSASVWDNARQTYEPQVATVAASDIERVLTAAQSEGIGLAVIDTAPHAAPEAARIARVADLVLLPCRPTALDLAAAEGAVRIVKAAKAKAAFVLSACPSRAPEIAECRKALADYGIPVAPAEITDRRAFSRAIASGRAVTETETDSRAAEEVRALWAWIKEQL